MISSHLLSHLPRSPAISQVLADESFPREPWEREPPPPERWPLSELAQACAVAGGAPGPSAFYPGRRFRSSRMVQSSTPPLLLPEFVLMSHNWAERRPSTAPRRLKNLTVVLDWVPDVASLKLPPQGEGLLGHATPQLSAAQEVRPQRGRTFADLPPPFRCPSAALLPPFHCPSAALPLPFRCPSAALPLPFHRLPTAFRRLPPPPTAFHRLPPPSTRIASKKPSRPSTRTTTASSTCTR